MFKKILIILGLISLIFIFGFWAENQIKINKVIIMNTIYKKEIKQMALQHGYKGNFILL